MSNRILPSVLAACVLLSATAAAESPSKLLRFPDVHTDWITFVYAGDIYLVGA